MSVERRDPDEIGDEPEIIDEEFDEGEVDADAQSPLDSNVIRERPVGRDEDEVEAAEQLLLDRKELNELGLELDNPEGFADE